MFPIRQNATHKVPIGPCVAVSDGFTPVTTLSLSTADEAEAILHDNGTVVDISGYTFTAITTADGHYHLTLQSGISGTVGPLRIVINDDSLCLPLVADFMVIEEAVYDALYASSAAGPLQSTVAGRTLDVTATGAAGIDWGNVENKTTANDLSGTDIQLADTVTTLTGHTAQTGDSYARLGAPAGASVSADNAAIKSNSDLIKTTTDKFVFTVANQVDANALAISGDTTAADNLEAQYDGTGLTGDAYPATQSQLDGVANVGSAVHKPASSYTLTTGTQSSGTVASTEALDGTRHEHTDAAGVLLIEYHFLIGGGTPSSVQITGYLTGANDTVLVDAYDWVAASYKQIGTINGSSSTSNSVYSFDLFVDMVGSGADEGKVDIKIHAASGLTSSTTAIDQIFVAFNQGSEGYDNGAVWFNSNASNTNTVVNIDGTARNPVSSVTALKSLLASTGLGRVEMTPGSTLTLDASFEGYDVNGAGGVLALGSQNIGGSIFSRFGSVTGVGTTSGNTVFFEDCLFGTATLPPSIQQQCGYGGTVTMGSAGDYTIVDGYSTVAGAGSPTFGKTASQAITAEWRRFSGGISCTGIESTDTYTIGGELGGVTLAGADGTVEIRNTYKSITDNRTGSPTLNIDGSIQAGDVADILVDTAEIGTAGAGLTDLGGMSTAMKAEVNAEADTAIADYDPPTNAEFEARTPTAAQLAYIVENAATGMPVTFTTSGGSTTAAVINQVDGASGSATDDQYNGRLLVFTNGTLKGVVTDITDYDGGTTTATITAIPFAPTASHTARLI